MDSHPIHFHGHVWETSSARTEARSRRAARYLAQRNHQRRRRATTRTMEFVADNPGDWPFHCHKNHHAMNAMTHDVPNVLGAKPAEFAATR